MLKKLYIEPTSLCNLNCSMCFRHNWFDEALGSMSQETTAKLYDIFQIPTLETVFFGGMGEPLMHPQIHEMIRTAHSAGKRTELLTNATLLKPEMSEKLLSTGLDMLWVSMDGFSKESYESIRKGSMYALVTDHLTAFNKLRKHTGLGITFVVMKENEQELTQLNQFADAFRVDMLNISHVIPGVPLAEQDSIYDCSFPVGKMHRFSDIPTKKQYDHCTFVNEGICFIRWDGEVCPCMQLLHNSYTYLGELHRKVFAKSYGNIHQTDFRQIWNQPDYVRFRDYVKRFDYPSCTMCLGCDLRLENKEDCMHNIHPTCGACLWAQGYARCP